MCRQLLTFLLIAFLHSPASGTLRADLDGNCRVDIHDLAILMSEWMLQEDCEMALGPELITNGTFETDSNWDKGDGWSISPALGGDGVGRFISPSFPYGGLISPTVPVVLESGKTYQITIKIILQSGAGIISAAGEADITTSGTYLFNKTMLGDANFSIEASCSTQNVVWDIDDVSVREVLPDTGGDGGQLSIIDQLWAF